MNKPIVSTALISLILGIAMGWGGTTFSYQHHLTFPAEPVSAQSTQPTYTNSTNNQSQNPKSIAFGNASTLRATINSLLKEHTVLAGLTLTNMYDGKDITRLSQLMEANANEIGTLVQNLYGQNARDQFMSLWMQHMAEYRNYTIARKSNNTQQMTQARDNLTTIATNMGNLLGRTSKNMPANTVTALMAEHVAGTLSLVDAYAAKDLTRVADLTKNNYDQAGKFADTVTQGILLDKPTTFK